MKIDAFKNFKIFNSLNNKNIELFTNKIIAKSYKKNELIMKSTICFNIYKLD